MPTITKRELIVRLAESTETKQSSVRAIVQCFLDEITAELTRDNRLEFRDFGVFEIKEREARMGQNPKTMEKVHIPAKRTVRFKMGMGMKEKLSNGTTEGEHI